MEADASHQFNSLGAAIIEGDVQSLLRAFHILEQVFPVQPSARESYSIEALLEKAALLPETPVKANQLQLKEFSRQIFPGVAIDKKHRGAFMFVDLLFSKWLHATHCHPKAYLYASQLTIVAAIRLIQRPDIAIRSEHPLSAYLEKLFNHLTQWNPLPGKQGDELPNYLKATYQRLRTLDFSDHAALASLENDLSSIVDKELARATMVNQRAMQSARDRERLDTAKSTLNEFVDQTLCNSPMPRWITDYIESDLLQYLQHLLMTDQKTDDRWQTWRHLLSILAEIFNKIDQQAAPSQTEINESLRIIENVPPPTPTDTLDYTEFLDSLSAMLIALANGTPWDTSTPMHTLALRGMPPTIQVSQTIIDELSHYQKGSWFQLSTKDEPHCKAHLSSTNELTGELTLTRYDGKQLTYSSQQDFAVGIAANIVCPLAYPNRHSANLKKCLALLTDKIKHAEAHSHTQRNTAANKAMSEAATIEAQSATTTTEALAQPEYLPKDYAGNLRCGAWLESYLEGSPLHMRLAVKLTAKDCYIFTDRQGRKLAELSEHDIDQHLASGQFRILSNGEDIDNSLKKIVRGLRKTP